MFRRKTISQAEQENNEAALRESKVKTFQALSHDFDFDIV